MSTPGTMSNMGLPRAVRLRQLSYTRKTERRSSLRWFQKQTNIRNSKTQDSRLRHSRTTHRKTEKAMERMKTILYGETITRNRTTNFYGESDGFSERGWHLRATDCSV